MMKISEFGKALGISAVDVSNWLTRLELRTSYAETVSGSARRFSVENVLELALINAFVKAGWMPQSAVAMADTHVRNFRSGFKIPEWVVCAAGNYRTGRMADTLAEISFDELTKDQPDQAPVFSAVRVGEIVRRVEKLFDVEGNHG